jgi:pimeloyl-ACP methyl ester carboxylesterase
MADWAVQVLDATGIEKAALVGHSMGSLIALEASARHPGRVEKLVFDRHRVPDGGVGRAVIGQAGGQP